ncbi:peptidoglycan DD-metalloendopeptidase family protein [Rhizobium sp. FKL33]|uniref:peptidoglycan DD-metalloendopeptidase family protein n=1 Tax=Rhizobium sp. FKL33 TaxID=2562307 RepID=UPI0010C12458|nr:peptidoglycan DD-metalloendopeptidase family protein [Rhizobium sp. FKL33]
MRSYEVVKSRMSSIRLVTVLLLAGAATGCSSDVTRFDSLFSRSRTDTLTTASVPHRVNAVNGKVPTPRANIANGDVYGNDATNQPYPGQPYDALRTSTVPAAPSRVQRAELSAPGQGGERVALAQPMPARQVMTLDSQRNADPIRTGSAKSIWKVTSRSPRVEIKSGQTLSGLSARYGVPQREILRANNMESAADLKYGRTVVIPVTDSVAQAMPPAVEGSKKVPVPGKAPAQEQAALPASLQDKKKAVDAKLADAGDAPDGAGYVVKPGDSLAKIARANKVSIEALKRANGMQVADIRIGQKLVIPAAGAVAADPVKTAAVPEGQAVKQATAAKPKTYTPPAAEKSVAEVQKSSDNGEDAPDATGIGKFRWPVRGAVIAGYGQNVDGARNTGIDISVPEGTPVKAAENGVVIYSGSGLKDLGNTVLVRHDDGTVTVYGNAAALNVKRGDKVTRGQVIANSGMSGGAKRPKLHFEVRQNAVAVNPMTFLQ